jgi:hypothetical protein
LVRLQPAGVRPQVRHGSFGNGHVLGEHGELMVTPAGVREQGVDAHAHGAEHAAVGVVQEFELPVVQGVQQVGPGPAVAHLGTG